MKTVFKVALIALLWIIVINPGKVSGDTLARLQIAHAWWTNTPEVSYNPQEPPKSRLDNIGGVLGVGGKRYSGYDVGQSLLMLPADWLGSQLHQVFPKQDELFLRRVTVNFLVFIPLNLATVIACFWLLRLFDFSDRVSGLASLTLLLSTTVLHYAQSFQQNNQILLFVTIGYATALACIVRDKSYWAVISGLALGMAFLIRMTSFMHVITVFLFLLGCLLYKIRNKLKILQRLGWWIVGLIPFILLGRVIDYLRFGSFWVTGATLARKQLQTDPIFSGLPELPLNFPFTNPPWVGIWGVLLSPAKSIFIYDPLLLPCLVLGIVLWKKLAPYLQWYLITAILNLCLHIAFYSRLDFWHGDAAWGARYHVTSVHLLLIPLIALLIQYFLEVSKVRRWVIAGIITLAIMVQITSLIFTSSINGGSIYGASPSSFNKFRLSARIQTIGCLVNPAFAQDCPSRLANNGEPLIQKVALLPFAFTQRRGLIFMAWGAVLVAAIASTYRFYRIG